MLSFELREVIGEVLGQRSLKFDELAGFWVGELQDAGVEKVAAEGEGFKVFGATHSGILRDLTAGAAVERVTDDWMAKRCQGRETGGCGLFQCARG